jgi:arabinose-5-phosphate isomerase
MKGLTDTSYVFFVFEIISPINLQCRLKVFVNTTLAGIITDGDVRRILQNHEDIRPLMASAVMTQHPLTIHPMARVGEALTLMEERERQISVLAVTNDQRECVGIVRVHDIVRFGMG